MSVQATGGTGGPYGSSGLSGAGRAQEAAKIGSSPQSDISGVSAGNSSDQVSLSNLSAAVQAQRSNSPERGQKVSQLSADVGSGSYRVDPQALSGAIVRQSLRA